MLTEKELKKHILWIDQAQRFSNESKDRSTHVGCVFVRDGRMISSGWNGFPEGVNDDVPARHERPTKYEWTVCAEQNAINNAARLGNSTLGATAYMNWDPYCPCGKCMANMRNSGIIRLVGPDRPFGGKGAGKYYHMSTVTREIIAETGIEVITVPYDPITKTLINQ